MATAKREGGLYFVPNPPGVEGGRFVDAEGVTVADAPALAPDTPPSAQPGAFGVTPEERMGVAIATALRSVVPAGPVVEPSGSDTSQKGSGKGTK